MPASRQFLRDSRNKSLSVDVKRADPVGIVREAIRRSVAQAEKAKNSATESYDQTWVVFDREKQNDPRREQTAEALQIAKAKGVKVALSIPSFEFWLLLHFHFTTSSFDGCDAVKRTLKKFIRNYEKADLPLDNLLDRVSTAMKHAKKCHRHWESAGGDRNPSTNVDELIAELNASARSDVRLF
jgi:hypothetical protein